MKKTKKFVVSLLVLFLILGVGANVFAETFTDTKNHWALKYIEWAAKEKMVEGYGNGLFKPEGKITQAEFYKMVNRFGGFDHEVAVHFSDVKTTDWFHKEVAVAVGSGYLADSYGSCNPNASMTRDEAARIIAAAYNLKDDPKSVKMFKDSAQIINKGAIGALVDKKVLNGYPNGSYKPAGTITRAEFAKILYVAKANMGKPAGKEVKTGYPTLQAVTCPGYETLKTAVDKGQKIIDDKYKDYPDATASQKTTLEKEVKDGKVLLEKHLFYTYKFKNFEDYYGATEDIYANREEAKKAFDKGANDYSKTASMTESEFIQHMKKEGLDESIAKKAWKARNPKEWGLFKDAKEFHAMYKNSLTEDKAKEIYDGGKYSTYVNACLNKKVYEDAAKKIDDAIAALKGTVKVKVTFKKDADTSTVITVEKGGKISAINFAEPTAETGKIFLGWFDKEEGGSKYTEDTVINSDVTLYPQWADKVTLSFDTDGAGTITAKTFAKGTTLTAADLPTPTKEGFTFEGWFKGTKEIKAGYTINEDLTVEAKWTAVPTFTLTLTDATAKPEGTSFAKGTTVTVTANVPEGKEFDKWTAEGLTLTEEQAAKKEFTFKMPGKNVTLTATFKNPATLPKVTKVELTGQKNIVASKNEEDKVKEAVSTALADAKIKLTFDNEESKELETLPVPKVTVDTEKKEVTLTFEIPEDSSYDLNGKSPYTVTLTYTVEQAGA